MLNETSVINSYKSSKTILFVCYVLTILKYIEIVCLIKDPEGVPSKFEGESSKCIISWKSGAQRKPKVQHDFLNVLILKLLGFNFLLLSPNEAFHFNSRRPFPLGIVMKFLSSTYFFR